MDRHFWSLQALLLWTIAPILPDSSFAWYHTNEEVEKLSFRAVGLYYTLSALTKFAGNVVSFSVKFAFIPELLILFFHCAEIDCPSVPKRRRFEDEADDPEQTTYAYYFQVQPFMV